MMRSMGLGIGLVLALVACSGGGSGGGTPDGGGSGNPPGACALDSDCIGPSRICDAGVCRTVADDGTTPHVVASGPRALDDVGVREPIWFRFDEPMRIAPGGFVLLETFGTRRFDATAELSADLRTLTLHPIGVAPPGPTIVPWTSVKL